MLSRTLKHIVEQKWVDQLSNDLPVWKKSETDKSFQIARKVNGGWLLKYETTTRTENITTDLETGTGAYKVLTVFSVLLCPFTSCVSSAP